MKVTDFRIVMVTLRADVTGKAGYAHISQTPVNYSHIYFNVCHFLEVTSFFEHYRMLLCAAADRSIDPLRIIKLFLIPASSPKLI